MRKRWVALALAVAPAGCSGEAERPALVFLPEMNRSVPYDAYDPNEATGSGQTLLAPPPGTRPRSTGAFPYGSGPDEARRAGEEMANPFAATPENVARGEAVYRNVCIVCHGAKGEGDGPIVGRFPNPPSLLADRARRLPDGAIYHIVTRGQGIMASHAAQVLPDDRWRVIHYLRVLQGVSKEER